MTILRTPLAERFWPRVNRTDDCWLWLGPRNVTGYGVIGRGGHQGGAFGAHRAAWILMNGPIPDGLSVLHRCDNPPCVNPSHLFLGTQADNLADARAKGRLKSPSGPGERNGHAKLTWAQVREIRAKYRNGYGSQTVLAREFNVPQSHISRIVLNRAWVEEV